jgi:hypothetical protein
MLGVEGVKDDNGIWEETTRESKPEKGYENRGFIRYQLKSNGKDRELNRAESVLLSARILLLPLLEIINIPQ